MFFLHDLERSITLHPSFFGPRIRDYLTTRLMADVEGTNTGNYFIVCVLDTYDISEGRVIPGSAFAEYTVHYRAVVWRPFKGEALDGIVSSVVHNGFFVDIGPLTVFVSIAMMPSDMKYDGNATPPQFTDNRDVIEKGTHIRVKIKGIRGEVGQMYAIGTIKEDYLGMKGARHLKAHISRGCLWIQKSISWPNTTAPQSNALHFDKVWAELFLSGT